MQDIGPPNLFNTFQEAVRATMELVTLQAAWGTLKSAVPGGNGAPILVLPGFGFDDWTTRPLRGFLRETGYYAHAWRGGINTGYNEKAATHLSRRLDEIADRHGRKVNLIGHSLGGIFARELAKNHPDKVERVVTLGSPFGAFAHPDSAMPGLRMVFSFINPKLDEMSRDAKVVHARMLTPPPVPTTSLYSRNDGVVNGLTCINPRASRVENVEVYSSHVGLIANPLSLLVIADRMAQDAKKWQPFDRGRYPSMLFRNRELHDEFTPENPAAPDCNPALSFA